VSSAYSRLVSARRTVVLLATWSVVVVAIVLLWPSGGQTPGCASSVGRVPGCEDLLNAMNDHVWWSQTVPLLLVMSGGFALILGLGLRAWRQRRDPGREAR
jgi:hypothetical protein